MRNGCKSEEQLYVHIYASVATVSCTSHDEKPGSLNFKYFQIVRVVYSQNNKSIGVSIQEYFVEMH
jgi:hypothetical protein